MTNKLSNTQKQQKKNNKQPEIVISSGKPQVLILARSSTSELTPPTQHASSSARGPSALASDLFKENKKDDQVKDVTDRSVFKLRIDLLTAQKITFQIKKKTMFTCYTSAPDVMVTQQSNNNPKIITIPDDEDNFVLIAKNFTVYTKANNLPVNILRAERAHEAIKLLKDYPGFKYTAPAYHFITDDNNKRKKIKVIKTIFSSEDGYNKLLQDNFHFKITEEDDNGKLKETTTSFKFKPAFVKKPRKTEE
ncbi:hypothetical protein RCL_jg14134.t1 [Rhizophagus clarus]|uniref:Uncharacterized protein n=1 Tax=Rhizophagus clarus TaxID=94130 RepID=A0A8H3QVQ3_9GLOM|nr:hypothetical protein RCL_jg14134.t1 [Rhizophagus clarus]